MNEVLDYLRAELAKRTAPWWGKDRLGNEGMQPPLCTAIVLMPNQVKELLRGIDGPPAPGYPLLHADNEGNAK